VQKPFSDGGLEKVTAVPARGRCREDGMRWLAMGFVLLALAGCAGNTSLGGSGGNGGQSGSIRFGFPF